MRLEDLKPGESGVILKAESKYQERGLREGFRIQRVTWGGIYRMFGTLYILKRTTIEVDNGKEGRI